MAYESGDCNLSMFLRGTNKMVSPESTRQEELLGGVGGG